MKNFGLALGLTVAVAAFGAVNANACDAHAKPAKGEKAAAAHSGDHGAKSGEKAASHHAEGASCPHHAGGDKNAKAAASAHAGHQAHAGHASSAGKAKTAGHSCDHGSKASASHSGHHAAGASASGGHKHAAGASCDMKAGAAKTIAMKGKVLCRSCNLKQSDACEKLFQPSDNTAKLIPICPESKVDLEELADEGNATLYIRGKLTPCGDKKEVLLVEQASLTPFAGSSAN